jgi:2-polyprenyl-3-methyl-5-hydroxy-6-metoxy-1,4-benzoquinol methylase
MKERVLYNRCPLCESENIFSHVTADCSGHHLYNKKLQSTIKWNKCSACNHIFTEGFYTDEACSIIFSKTNENQKVGANLENNRMISSRMVEKVLPYASEGVWLDVGFGNGSLLFTAQEYGFTPIGTDLRADNVNILNSIGIEAHQKKISDLVLQDDCSVISMADVLEHMPYPKEALMAVNKLLRNGGVLLISLPNSENIVWETMNNQHMNPYWGEIEHYHNFSRTRLYSLLSEYGFRPMRYGVSERYRVCMEVVAQKV